MSSKKRVQLGGLDFSSSFAMTADVGATMAKRKTSGKR